MSKYYEDFYAGRALVYVSIYQHTRHGPSGYCTMYILLAYYRKGGILKEGILERGKYLKEGKVAREGCMKEREMLRERKMLREGNINGRKTAREGRC